MSATDRELEAILAAIPAEAWAELRRLAQALDALEEPAYTYAGGERLPNGDITMAYPIYHDVVEQILRWLSQQGVVSADVDWTRWAKDRGGPISRFDPHAESFAEGVRMVTAVVRGERFHEGTVGCLIEEGTFSTLLRRLLAYPGP